jgi:6-phosphogluconolactonase (cycloisomerase 2 family)
MYGEEGHMESMELMLVEQPKREVLEKDAVSVFPFFFPGMGNRLMGLRNNGKKAYIVVDLSGRVFFYDREVSSSN